jgi:hypothetical protein
MEVQLHSFLISVLDGDEWADSHAQPLYPWEGSRVPTEFDAGWATGPAWTF